MSKLCIFVVTVVFGWTGWWIGAKFGPITALVVGALASFVGAFVGWRINRDYLT